MYRWLRRLITINNDFVMDQTHYELEHLLKDTPESVPKRPIPRSYSCCEKLSGQSFSCGSLNESEFVEFCARELEIDEQIRAYSSLKHNVFSEADPQLLPKVIEPPQLDIDIEMNCPIELAPIEYLEKSPLNNFESLWSRIFEPIDPAQLQGRRSEFFFNMIVRGPGLSRGVMPSWVHFQIKSSDFGNANSICPLRNKDCCSRSL
jgi:hypothetical protein